MTEMALDAKKRLLKKLVNDPLQFTDADFDTILADDLSLTFKDIRGCVLSIFDINESILLEESDANGPFNRKSQRKRVKEFYNKFREGHDRRAGKVIVAEGDSWFEFPFFINDIIDHLNDNNKYAIHSLAYGGDWLTNIVYEGKYVEKLSVLQPDVFLVSGGGNDLVGSDRLGIMVNPKKSCPPRYKSKNELALRVNALYNNYVVGLPSEEDMQVFLEIQNYVRPAFYAFLKIMKLQYTLMFSGIHKKFPDIQIITQAYDYAIPSPDYHGLFFNKQYWVNRLLQTGKWLYIPLMINGITDRSTQTKIIRYMIFEFNLMFAEIALSKDNVYHVDCRGVAKSTDDWYDELHLKSPRYKVIANAYTACIEKKHADRKIVFAREFDKPS